MYIAEFENNQVYQFNSNSDLDAIAEVQKRFPEVNQGMACLLKGISDAGIQIVMDFSKTYGSVLKIMRREFKLDGNE